MMMLMAHPQTEYTSSMCHNAKIETNNFLEVTVRPTLDPCSTESVCAGCSQTAARQTDRDVWAERPILSGLLSHCSINYSQAGRANKGHTYEHPWSKIHTWIRDGSMCGEKG